MVLEILKLYSDKIGIFRSFESLMIKAYRPTYKLYKQYIKNRFHYKIETFEVCNLDRYINF